MGMIRNCLMMIGLAVLAAVTSCTVGISSCNRLIDPTHFFKEVDETPDKTRRMLMAYLDAATYEGPADWKLDGKATKLLVQEYTDGSIHLSLDGTKGRMMEIVAKVAPVDGGTAQVEVVSDAKILAEARNMTPHQVHRRIRDMLTAAMDAINDHRVVEGGFLISRLLGEREHTRRRF
jgi:hypothetical protein